MTYRRLYLNLLVIGTLLLGGVWWHSMRTFSSIILQSPDHKVISVGLLGAVHCGTLSMAWIPGGGGGSSGFFDFESRPVSGLPRYEQYGVMGKFEINPHAHELDCFEMLLPLWLVHLLAAGAGFALMRWGERRAGRSVEKALALRDTGEDVAVEKRSGKEAPAP